MSFLSRHAVLTALFLAVVALALGGRRAAAHGDEVHAVLEGAPLGPYTVTVWLSPPDLRPGEVHVAAAISDAGRPVLDCEVALTVIPLDSTERPVTAQAGPATPATGYRHEAQLTLPRDGRYTFTITARDPAGEVGRQQFDAVVRPVSPWMNALIYGQLLLAPVVGLWLLAEGFVVWRRWRRARRSLSKEVNG
ncbi:MAG: hypothetical protein ACOC8X_10720 [Chloroflexota bacterium]